MSLLGKGIMGKTQATLQYSCSNLGERVSSPNGRVFSRGQYESAHFATEVCVYGRETSLAEGKAEFERTEKMKHQKMDAGLHG